MRIKICGLTRKEDVSLAATLGAWALGFIFYPKSPRYIDPSQAALIKDSIKTPAVGVFVNQVPDVLDIAKTAILQGIQLHGDETPDDCAHMKERFGGFVIKAFRPKKTEDLSMIPAYKNVVDYILVDAAGDAYGGTGKQADWDCALIAKTHGIPLILAGGLGAENILTAKISVDPYAFDLSSQIEDSPGIKSPAKMNQLFEYVKGFSS